MERLTYKDGFGKWAFLLNGAKVTGKIAEKLAQYENLGDPVILAPVVRCCDCKYNDDGFCDYTLDGGRITEDFYCSIAVKRGYEEMTAENETCC
jgi:hypothetical protein